MPLRLLPLGFGCLLLATAAAQDQVPSDGTAPASSVSPGSVLAFVETASPSGIDPCGPQAVSTAGCEEYGGNNVEDSFNSDRTYILGVSGAPGSRESLLNFAPHDYEIRFTAQGSYAVYPFTTSDDDLRAIKVPFEIWDVGDEPPFSTPDPTDDVQLVPVLFADSGISGACAFDFGEATLFGRPASDRIYAYYPMDTDGDGDRDNADYAAFAAAASAVVPTDDACAEGQAVLNGPFAFIDFGLGRPLQRQVFVDQSGTGDVSVLQNTVVKFYTTSAGPGGGNPTDAEGGPDGPLAELGAAHPNPVRGVLAVPYRLGQAAEARVAVFDALGREVAVLAEGAHAAGPYTARLDPAASGLAAGVYTVVLEAGEVRAIQRVVVVR